MQLEQTELEQTHIEQVTDFLVDEFGDDYPWRWDEQKNVRLSEFASNKKEKIYQQLESIFPHKWDRKSIKNAPHNLKQELGDLTKLKDNQVLFTRPAQDEAPALLAIWWPWGHGGTVSLRLTVLSENYLASEIRVPKEGLLTLIKKLFN